jgi:D-glycero-D-manno-heptose 1,7-bisphosphate phosphatase
VTSRRPAVFLDRDGTINEEVDFVRTPDQLALIPGAAVAIRRLNRAGLLTCVISNQSGVGRGFYTEEDLTLIHARLTEDLKKEEAMLDRIYYCPHHPTEGVPPYNITCACRKPSPGMLLAAQRELDVDLQRSTVVGDRSVDILAGRAVGARTVLVLTGYGQKAAEECAARGIHPDHTVASIVDAVAVILGEDGTSG